MPGLPSTPLIQVRPLSGCIGLEVTGVSLSSPLDDVTLHALHDAFLSSDGVLVIPGQFLTPAQQHDFAVRWGTPIVTPHLVQHSYPGYPDVLRVTNTGKANAVTEAWHCDSIFLPEPPPITILAAQDMPAAGGDTMWANQYVAFQRLSSGMQRMLRGIRGRFVGTQPSSESGGPREVEALHPIARVHPETDRVALLAGHPGDSLVSLEDMTPAESRPLLEFLYLHATQPDLIYRHHWRQGDVVMWDNRCTLHYAVHDYGEATRTLSRVTLAT
jgi:taurine dioxygenase